MRVKIQAASPAPKPDYPLHAYSFALSVATHCAGIAALLFVTFPDSKSARPVYDELIRPQEHKIVYYDFRKQVPDVDPVQQAGRSPQPRGAELSRQAIIATSPKPRSKQVFISVPAPDVEIHQDLPAPLLVAKIETSLPPPPAPPKPKKFVPPPPLNREPKLPMQTPVLEAQAPAINSPAVAAPVPAPTPTLKLSEFTAPPKESPVAPTANKGNAKADIAIASLHPAETPEARLPNGELPARFSKAPTQGAAASGDAVASVNVPDLTIRQPKKDSALETPMKAILYSETVRSVSVSTLSVPLRPAGRMIPQSIDARFQGRSVYTMAVPIENMPAYDGDWIMWFADRESKPGETPLIRAPLPFRKLAPVFEVPPSGRTQELIQFAATLGKNGRLDGITLLTKATPAVQRAVLQDVTAWEFQPATRSGVPVDVDVVMEIRFNLPTAIAKSTLP